MCRILLLLLLTGSSLFSQSSCFSWELKSDYLITPKISNHSYDIKAFSPAFGGGFGLGRSFGTVSDFIKLEALMSYHVGEAILLESTQNYKFGHAAIEYGIQYQHALANFGTLSKGKTYPFLSFSIKNYTQQYQYWSQAENRQINLNSSNLQLESGFGYRIYSKHQYRGSFSLNGFIQPIIIKTTSSLKAKIIGLSLRYSVS